VTYEKGEQYRAIPARVPDDVQQGREDDPFPQIAHFKKRAFLVAYACSGRIRRASADSGVDWRNHYNWIRDDPTYIAAFEYAKELAADFLEDEAIRRAVEGVQRGVYHRGDKVGEETIYSDILLMFMLKGFRPEKYRDNGHLKVESEVNVNVSIEQRTREAHERLLRLRHGGSGDPATP
jgi:hypothetical protein